MLFRFKNDGYILHTVKRKTLIGLVTSCKGTVFKIHYWRNDKRRDISDENTKKKTYPSCWMTLRKGEEALNRILLSTRLGKGCGPVERQTTEWMNEWVNNTSTVTRKMHNIKFPANTSYAFLTPRTLVATCSLCSTNYVAHHTIYIADTLLIRKQLIPIQSFSSAIRSLNCIIEFLNCTRRYEV